MNSEAQQKDDSGKVMLPSESFSALLKRGAQQGCAIMATSVAAGAVAVAALPSEVTQDNVLALLSAAGVTGAAAVYFLPMRAVIKRIDERVGHQPKELMSVARAMLSPSETQR